jgi:pimeloyl-ACP methyl ester carboxylesterase
MAVIAAPRNSTTVRKSLSLTLLRLRFAVGGWLMPDTTLGRAFRLFGTPMSNGRERARQCSTAGAQIVELPFGRERMTTYVWGDPQNQPAVMLAHGWSSFGLRFLPWVEPLRRAGYAVIALDQPAHGRSSGFRATLPMFAEGVSRVAAHFGPLAAVIGHSLGGAATMIALAKGLQTQRVVLIAPAADPMAAGQRFGRFIGLSSYLSNRIFEEFESLTGISVDGLQAHVNAPHIGRPLLVVHDIEDTEVPWAEGERYARYCPHARLLTTEGLGHHRVANDPAVIGDALRFLQGETIGSRVVSSPNLPYGFA